MPTLGKQTPIISRMRCGPVSPHLPSNPHRRRSNHQFRFAEREAKRLISHSWLAVSEPTWDLKSPLQGGQPQLTARGPQLVPDPQLTAGQERSEHCDAQHTVRVQDQVAVEAGGTLLYTGVG